MFEVPAALLAWFYSWTNGYIAAIALMAVVVMAITTPLTLKSTKGMLEMQKVAPEMRRLQNEYRNDRQKLNEEMMKLYQEHQVNPMSSCLPLVAQMPVFIIMFRILRGLEYRPTGSSAPIAEATATALDRPDVYDPEVLGFIPRYLSLDSDLYLSLFGETEILSLGLDLSLSPIEAMADSATTGIIYALGVVLLGALYFGQQKMVAARASISPTMSPTQQKLMQYLPVVFAVFQLFFMMGLVIYYIFQTILRILQQFYITKRFYGHDESLGRQAQRATEQAREEAKKNGESTGFLAQARRDLTGGGGSSSPKANDKDKPAREIENKRVTPSKSGKAPQAEKGKGRPTPSRKSAQAKRTQARPKSTRPKSSQKKKR